MGLGFRAPALASAIKAEPAAPATMKDVDWRSYGGDLASTRYAALDQVNSANFNDLEVAWRLKLDNFGRYPEYKFESTPLVVGGILYTTAGSRRDVLALDATTGEIVWVYRLDEGERAMKAPRRLSGHGVAYWTDGATARILFVTIGYQLVCLDAHTGIPDPHFGTSGIVDLKRNDDQDITGEIDDIGLHSTPCICRDIAIVGAAHSSGERPRHHANVRGYVRGFDVRTGQRRWIFHTIPQPGEYGYESWTKGTGAIGNGGVWAQISADPELGLAYLPVELPTGDINGEYRSGNGLFGESVVAIDVETGKRRWHYQTIHHGLWDYDLPAAPILLDLPVHGRIVKALAQPTKQAFLYVLDRTNGKPIWPIVERKVPVGDVPGEWYAATQPFPTRPPAYDVQGLAEKDLIDFTPDLRADAIALLKNYKTGPIYTPPSVASPAGSWGTIVLPGVTGGANWPGGAYDPETHRVFIYSKTDPTVCALYPNKDQTSSDFHYVGAEVGGKSTLTARGKLQPGELTVDGLPLVRPPWGRITAIDMTEGAIAWQVAHGATPDDVKNHPRLKGVHLPRTGQAGFLGVLATRSLLICGDASVTTADDGRHGAMLRAYDKATGKEVGSVLMPAQQSGSPMTYMTNGKQYIVVCVSGGNYSAEIIAYRLPAS